MYPANRFVVIEPMLKFVIVVLKLSVKGISLNYTSHLFYAPHALLDHLNSLLWMCTSESIHCVDNINNKAKIQIPCCVWLPERARCSDTACSRLPVLVPAITFRRSPNECTKVFFRKVFFGALKRFSGIYLLEYNYKTRKPKRVITFCIPLASFSVLETAYFT